MMVFGPRPHQGAGRAEDPSHSLLHVWKKQEETNDGVWKKHEELAALPKFGGPAPALVVGDSALEGLDSSSSDSDSDCQF